MKYDVLILHNIRSCNNVGSLLRTAEGLGFNKVYFSGYTPFPAMKNDPRLPHITTKIDKQIHKTALGAERTISWEQCFDIQLLIKDLRKKKIRICAVEQSKNSTKLHNYKPEGNIALILGHEVEGIENEVLSLCDLILEIPMFGKKESYNVAIAGAITMYHVKLLAN